MSPLASRNSRNLKGKASVVIGKKYKSKFNIRNDDILVLPSLQVNFSKRDNKIENTNSPMSPWASNNRYNSKPVKLNYPSPKQKGPNL